MQKSEIFGGGIFEQESPSTCPDCLISPLGKGAKGTVPTVDAPSLPHCITKGVGLFPGQQVTPILQFPWVCWVRKSDVLVKQTVDLREIIGILIRISLSAITATLSRNVTIFHPRCNALSGQLG